MDKNTKRGVLRVDLWSWPFKRGPPTNQKSQQGWVWWHYTLLCVVPTKHITQEVCIYVCILDIVPEILMYKMDTDALLARQKIISTNVKNEIFYRFIFNEFLFFGCCYCVESVRPGLYYYIGLIGILVRRVKSCDLIFFPLFVIVLI